MRLAELKISLGAIFLLPCHINLVYIINMKRIITALALSILTACGSSDGSDGPSCSSALAGVYDSTDGTPGTLSVSGCSFVFGNGGTSCEIKGSFHGADVKRGEMTVVVKSSTAGCGEIPKESACAFDKQGINLDITCEGLNLDALFEGI